MDSVGKPAEQFLRSLGLMLCTALCAACAPSAAPVAEGGSSTPEAVEVITAPAVLRDLAIEIEAVGTAMANESVVVTAKVANSVSAIRFQEGDRVRRGSILVELDSPELQAAVSEAEAVLADSEAQYARSRTLSSQNVLSAAQLEQIEATLKANRARLDAARARLADTVIRAGFDGRTGFRRVSIGSFVNPGSAITTLDDDSTIKIEFTVPEIYLFLLKQGLEVGATTPGLPGRTFNGTVTVLDSRVDPNTRSVAVRAAIPNADGVLRPGMFMTVRLQPAATPAILVPEEAIIPEQGNAFVLVVADGMVERKQVRTGRRKPGEVELLTGVQPGERVVVQGIQNIRPGMRVREGSAADPPAPGAS